MVYMNNWEEFSKAVQNLYELDSTNFRFVSKYRMKDGLYLKATNDHVCLQYRTEYSQDVKKAEKLTSQLMRQMASKEA